MRYNVNASVFVAEPVASYGGISGTLELESEPVSGDDVSLVWPTHEKVSDSVFPGMPLAFIVNRVTHFPDSKLPPTLGFEDIVLKNSAEAEFFVAYVCKGFALNFDPTNPDDPAF